MICLVTGFGGFPGQPRNPTQALVRALARRRRRLLLAGIELRLAVLPVRRDAIRNALTDALDQASGRAGPDLVLHFGVAGRRRVIGVETRALNRAGPLRPDAAGRRAPSPLVEPGGPAARRALWPAAQIAASLRRAGFAAALSNDAGDYLCNELFYLSLGRAGAAPVGFIHVPPPRRLGGPSALAEAGVAAILAAARLSGRGRGAGAPRRAAPDARPGDASAGRAPET
ncbi:peptidase C15 [Methylocella sp.]|uniref:pyroglutamyl-peptidase I family protein n=1 Tax=Methylocella sp. TaxID=1978226 RepID=UPI003784DF73